MGWWSMIAGRPAGVRWPVVGWWFCNKPWNERVTPEHCLGNDIMSRKDRLKSGREDRGCGQLGLANVEFRQSRRARRAKFSVLRVHLVRQNLVHIG